MGKRKTIKVEDLKTKVNWFLKNTADDHKRERKTMGIFLEGILHETGNYNGFGYLHPNQMEDSIGGTTIGINQSRPQKDWFKDTDNSRVIYY